MNNCLKYGYNVELIVYVCNQLHFQRARGYVYAKDFLSAKSKIVHYYLGFDYVVSCDIIKCYKLKGGVR